MPVPPPKPPVKSGAPVAPPRPLPPPPPKPVRYRLLADCLSYFHDNKGKRKVYGRKDDVVREISRSGEVLIVEGPDKERYSVRIENLIKI